MSEAIPTRVIKLGGSLLAWRDFPLQLNAWLTKQSEANHLLIVGGGEVVDAIRALDEVHRFPEAKAHWLCIEALAVTAAVCAELLPGWQRLAAGLPTTLPTRGIVDVAGVMQLDTKRSVRPLPASWSVTSDSIAARAATLMGATELVLLKSAMPPKVTNIRALADADYVDSHFPVCAKPIPRVRFVNLRDPHFAELAMTNGPR